MGREGPGPLCPAPPSGKPLPPGPSCKWREDAQDVTVARVRPHTGLAAGCRSGATQGPRPPFPHLPDVVVHVFCSLPRPRVTRRHVAQHDASGHHFKGEITTKRHKIERTQRPAESARRRTVVGSLSAVSPESGWGHPGAGTRTSVDVEAARGCHKPASSQPQGARANSTAAQSRSPSPRARAPDASARRGGVVGGVAGLPMTSSEAADVIGRDRSQSSGSETRSLGGKRCVRVLCPTCPKALQEALTPARVHGDLIPRPVPSFRRGPGRARHSPGRPGGADVAEARAGASRGAAAARPSLAAPGTGRRVPVGPLRFPEPAARVRGSWARGCWAAGAAGSVGEDAQWVSSHGRGAGSGHCGGRCGRLAGASPKRETENQSVTQLLGANSRGLRTAGSSRNSCRPVYTAVHRPKVPPARVLQLGDGEAERAPSTQGSTTRPRKGVRH